MYKGGEIGSVLAAADGEQRDSDWWQKKTSPYNIWSIQGKVEAKLQTQWRPLAPTLTFVIQTDQIYQINCKVEVSWRLTEESEGPPHQRVEVTAVPGSHRLLRPVELFGRVLDQEQHRLGDCDLQNNSKIQEKDNGIGIQLAYQ